MKKQGSVKITSVENGYVIENLNSLTASIANSCPELIQKILEIFEEDYSLHVCKSSDEDALKKGL